MIDFLLHDQILKEPKMDPQGKIRSAVNRAVGKLRQTVSGGFAKAARVFGRGTGPVGVVKRTR